jgi:hypothetical protein
MMYVEVKLSEGGFASDMSVERIASYQIGTTDTREELHELIDKMWDAVEQKKIGLVDA